MDNPVIILGANYLGRAAKEIFESNCKPRVWEVEKIFKEDFFKEKYLLQVF